MPQLAYRYLLRGFTYAYYTLLQIISFVVPAARRNTDIPENILITGTFYSDQWLTTHLVPLAQSDRVNSIVMVASRPVPQIDGVKAVYPGPLLRMLTGEVGSRSLLFIWHGLKPRYQVLAGFHLLLNGMIAVLIARLTRKRSLYICGGGPREASGGGFDTENKIYGRLSEPDYFIEGLLLRTVNKIDITICMGTSAVEYFSNHRISSQMVIVPGGFPATEFYPANDAAEFDFILIGRLSQVKRVDLFLDVLVEVKKKHAGATAVIVGDGPDTQVLKDQVLASGLSDNVTFAGWQQNVGDWLRRSKIFILTSESEGLSQALLQAMMCGLPAIVSNVGDLKDIVQHGKNGYLIEDLDKESFTVHFNKLLEDNETFVSFQASALESTRKFQIPEVAQAWNKIL